MITVTIPDIPESCFRCRFNCYGDLNHRGSNFHYCILYNTAIEYGENREILGVKHCPNYKGNNHDE